MDIEAIKELHERTRQGKNICECGRPKIMYFEPWCPICGKNDALSSMPIVNIVQVFEFFIALDGSRCWIDGIWDSLMDFLDYPGNGSYVCVDINEILTYPEEHDPNIVAMFKRILKYFNVPDYVLIFSSW